jgi:hypothetical protein
VGGQAEGKAMESADEDVISTHSSPVYLLTLNEERERETREKPGLPATRDRQAC